MSTAGRIFAGAVKGVSKYGLDQIEQRQEEEREVRKAKLLNDLRMSTEKELSTFQYDLKKGEADKNFSSADEDFYILRNSRGEEVGKRALTAAEKRERALSLDKDQLEVENIRSQIGSRARDDARQDRYTNASIANMDAAKKAASEAGTDDADIANELLYRYSKEATETVKSGNISQSALRAAAIDIAKNARTGSEAQEQFLKFMNRYRTGRAKTAQATRDLSAGMSDD